MPDSLRNDPLFRRLYVSSVAIDTVVDLKNFNHPQYGFPPEESYGREVFNTKKVYREYAEEVCWFEIGRIFAVLEKIGPIEPKIPVFTKKIEGGVYKHVQRVSFYYPRTALDFFCAISRPKYRAELEFQLCATYSPPFFVNAHMDEYPKDALDDMRYYRFLDWPA